MVNSNEYCDGQYNDYNLYGPTNSIETLTNKRLKTLYLIQFIKGKKSLGAYEQIALRLDKETSCSLKYFAELTRLDPDLFCAFRGLTRIQISFNHRLKSLMVDGLFNGLKNLVSIDLSSNCLNELNWNIFDGLINLNELDLSKNCLSNLDSRIFQCLFSLKKIDLSYNRLGIIEAGLFLGLKNLVAVDLRHNNLRHFCLNDFKGCLID